MQSLYDLLGVRPDDDAETLRTAFRKAAKASHPDHHDGNPKAAERFRQIKEAYDILRDAEQRAAYDELLEFELRPLRGKLKRTVANVRQHVVQDVLVCVAVAAAFAGAYVMFANFREAPIDRTATVAAAAPAQQSSAAIPPMPNPVAAGPAAVSGTVAATANKSAASNTTTMASLPARQAIDVATRDSDSDLSIEATETTADRTTAGTRDPGTNHEAEPHGDRVSQPPDIQASTAGIPSAEEKDSSVPNAPSPGVVANNNNANNNNKGDNSTLAPIHLSTVDVKPTARTPARTKASARQPAVTKQQTGTRAAVEQASLENGNSPACADSCSDDDAQLVFGVGF